ncbi:hypothetical protein ACPA1H_23465 [Ectopseudomonas chengduensis]
MSKAFADHDAEAVCIFASGVSDSSCSDSSQFEREKNLLLETLLANRDKKFIYFSSCALSAPNYARNAYYEHKANMESLVVKNSEHFYIFRIPQLFGDLIHHKTIINYIYEAVRDGLNFNVYDDAHRYVIEINDVQKLVSLYLKGGVENLIVDIANTHRYRVVEIVDVFEQLLKKKADYQIVKKTDKYELNLSPLISFLGKHNVDMEFGEKYLLRKLAQKLK